MQLEARQLIERRSPDLAQRVLHALPPRPELQNAQVQKRAATRKRNWQLLLPLAAAALLLWLLTPFARDTAHPQLAPRGEAVPGQAKLDLGPATEGLRGLVSWGTLLERAPRMEAPANDLLEREARLLVSDVTRLAADVIAGLPLAGIPSAWKERLETL